MKRVSLFCLFLLLLSNSVSFAQTYAFKVMASSGKSTLKTNNKQLFVGSKISAADQIVIDSKSYLSLVNSKGETVQISKAGSYNAKDLETQLANAKKSNPKLISYVISEITKSEDNIAKSKYKYSNVTGSVERPIPDKLVVLVPKTSKPWFVTGNEYVIKWIAESATKNYLVRVTDAFEQEILKAETQDTTFRINIGSPELNKAEGIKIFISSKEKPDVKTEFGLVRIEEEKGPHSKFLSHLKTFEGENTGVEKGSTFDKLNKALFYEENMMLMDAMQLFEEVYLSDTSSEAYETAYKQFLIRHSIGETDSIKKSEN